MAPRGRDGADERVGDQGDADADDVGEEGGQQEAPGADEALDGDADREQGDDADEGAETGGARPCRQQAPDAFSGFGGGGVRCERVARKTQRRDVVDGRQSSGAEHEEPGEDGRDTAAAQPGEGGTSAGDHARGHVPRETDGVGICLGRHGHIMDDEPRCQPPSWGGRACGSPHRGRRGADQPSMKSRRAGPCAPMRHTRHPSMSCVCCAALAAAEGSRNLMPLDRVMMPSALSTAS